MKRLFEGCLLELVLGDITEQETDALVNAANRRLAGGGGVDGAIHRVGGKGIMAETRRNYPQGCPTGKAVITGAGRLAARWVIHAVGPVWGGGQRHEAELLSEAYRSCLWLAKQNHCQSIAFPSLSTGAYRYPVNLAAGCALQTVVSWLHEQRQPELVRFVLFDDRTLDAYTEQLKHVETGPKGRP